MPKDPLAQEGSNVAEKNPVVTLNGGEVSPLLYGRSDLAKYRSFQKTLNNFIVEPQGAIKRRLGTEIVARIGNVDEFIDSIAHPWRVNRDNYFQMIFIESEIRFFSSQGALVFTLPVPYSPEDFDQLYFRQIYDTMYICHPNYAPQLLVRDSQFIWSIAPATILSAFSTDNEDTAFTMAVTETTFPEVAIAATGGAPFSDTDVGRLIRILHSGSNSDSDSETGNLAGSAPLPASGQVVTLRTGGTWSGDVSLELSLDNQLTWTTIGSVSSKNNFNGEIIRDIPDFGAFIRISFVHSEGTMDWTLDVDGILYNTYEITVVNDDQNVLAEIIDGFAEEITTEWQWGLGAFSNTSGFPTCCEIFDERLFFGGVEAYPADIYVSQTNAWTNFLSGTLATSPFRFTLNADIRNRTRWFVVDQQLLLGTDNAEFTIGSRLLTEAISISNVTVQNQKEYGSDPVQPIRADSTSYFVEAGGRRIRSINYERDRDSYMSDDISIMATHLTKTDKIVKMAFSRTPDKIIWCLLDSGLLLSFTTEREQNVGAWSKHPLVDDFTGDVIGKIIDVNSILTVDGDVLTLIIERKDGVYFEQITPFTNDCIDAKTVFDSIVFTDVLALPGVEDFTYWNGAFVEKQVPFKGLGSFLRLDIVVTNLIIFYDGNLLALGVDYSEMTGSAFWIPGAPDNNLITVFDGVAPVDPGDFFTNKAIDCFVGQVDVEQNIIEFRILSNGIELISDVDYFTMSGDLQVMIIEPLTTDPTEITVEVIFGIDTPLLDQDSDVVLDINDDQVLITTGTVFEPLGIDQYRLFTPRVLISVYGDPTNVAYFGLKMFSLAELVDIYNSPDINGGQGGKRRYINFDTFVVDSVNFQVSGNADKKEKATWQTALFIEQEPQTDVKIPSVTDIIRTQTASHGYRSKASIGYRSNSPYELTIVSVNPYGSKTSARGD